MNTTDNKALADRLTSMASCITPGGLNDAEIALMREAAAALTPQADKARGEVRQPLDEELLAFATEEQFLLFCDGDEFVQIARAVLARFATPQPQGDGFTAADMMDARAEERPRLSGSQVSGGGEHFAEMVRRAMKMTASPEETCLDHEEYIEAVIEAALSTLQARPTIRVQKLGMYGAAYDGPEDKRAYTYTHQPANGPAYSLGHALSCAAIRQGGDFIDGGLSLLKELEAKGFGVFEIADLPAPSVQARPDGGEVVPWVEARAAIHDAYQSGVAGTGYSKVVFDLHDKITHPAPAPDVARLVFLARRHEGHDPQLRAALAPFIAAQQEDE